MLSGPAAVSANPALPVRSTPDQQRTQSYLVRANFVGSLSKEMIFGGYVVAFAVQVLALSNGQISWFLSVIPLIVLLRYPFLDVLRSYPRVYPTRAGRAIGLFCLTVLFVLPTQWITLPLLLALALLFAFGNEFLQNSVWTNFVAEVSTRADRGRFLGRLRTWKIVTAMLFALFGFFLVGDELDRGEHRLMLLVVMALLANALFWYAKVPAMPPPDQVRAFSGRGRFWHILRTSPLLRRPLLLVFIERVLAWPILTVYLIGSLHLPANLFMLTLMAGMLGPILSVFLWGKRADAGGVRGLYLVYFAASMLLYPLLLFVPDFAAVPQMGPQWLAGLAALLCFYFLQGVLSAGQEMAQSLYHSHFANNPDGFHALNILTMLSQLMLSAMTALGGLLLVRFGDVEISGFGSGGGFVWLDPFRIVMLGVIAAICLAGLGVAARIDRGL